MRQFVNDMIFGDFLSYFFGYGCGGAKGAPCSID